MWPSRRGMSRRARASAPPSVSGGRVGRRLQGRFPRPAAHAAPRRCHGARKTTSIFAWAGQSSIGRDKTASICLGRRNLASGLSCIGTTLRGSGSGSRAGTRGSRGPSWVARTRSAWVAGRVRAGTHRSAFATLGCPRATVTAALGTILHDVPQKREHPVAKNQRKRAPTRRPFSGLVGGSEVRLQRRRLRVEPRGEIRDLFFRQRAREAGHDRVLACT